MEFLKLLMGLICLFSLKRQVIPHLGVLWISSLMVYGLPGLMNSFRSRDFPFLLCLVPHHPWSSTSTFGFRLISPRTPGDSLSFSVIESSESLETWSPLDLAKPGDYNIPFIGNC